MGMFDKPQYLTGKDGFVEPGEEFYLHNAKIEGTSNVNGVAKPQAKLLVSKDGNTTMVVFTSGNGVVGQIQRMDDNDRATFPVKVRLDEIPSGKGNPTRVITPADQPPAAATVVSGNGESF